MNSTVMASTAIMTILIGCCTANAQQIVGTPGSPSATVTIDGKQLPPPPTPFGGVIKENAKEFEALLATDGGATQGRAERAAHHDR